MKPQVVPQYISPPANIPWAVDYEPHLKAAQGLDFWFLRDQWASFHEEILGLPLLWNCAVLVFWFFLKPRHSLMGIDMQNYHELPYFLEKVALVTNLHQSLKILHVKTFFHRLQDIAWLCGKKIIPWERIAWVTRQSTAFGPRFQCGLAKAWWISVQLWEVFGTFGRSTGCQMHN